MVMKKSKVIGITLAGVITLSSLSCVNVLANDSKPIQYAKAKISHLTWSLHNNYLGLKNQATWEGYVKESRNLISRIPVKDSATAKELSVELDRDQSLINALARVNQVEKSMEINANIIKNVPQWEEYIRLAEIDLPKVNKKTFPREIRELEIRIELIKSKIKAIKEAEEGSKPSNDSIKKLEYIIKNLTDKIAELEKNQGNGGGSGGSSNDSLIKDLQNTIKDLQNQIKDLQNQVNDGSGNPGDGNTGGDSGSTNPPVKEKSKAIPETDIKFIEKGEGVYDVKISNLVDGEKINMYKRPYDETPILEKEVVNGQPVDSIIKTENMVVRKYMASPKLLNTPIGGTSKSGEVSLSDITLDRTKYAVYVSRVEEGKEESERTEGVYDASLKQEVQDKVDNIKDQITNGNTDTITPGDIVDVVGQDGKDLVTDGNKDQILDNVQNMDPNANLQDELLRIIKQVVAINTIESVTKGGDASYITIQTIRDSQDDASIVVNPDLAKYQLQIAQADDGVLNNKGKIANMIKAIPFIEKIDNAVDATMAGEIKVLDLTSAIDKRDLVIEKNIDTYRSNIASLAKGELNTISKIESMIRVSNAIVKIDSIPLNGDVSSITLEDIKLSVKDPSTVLDANLQQYKDAISKAEDNSLNTIDKISALVNTVNNKVIEDSKNEAELKSAKETLAAKIAEAKALKQTSYTTESWATANLTQIIVKAQEVYDNSSSTKEQLLTEIANLENSIGKLVLKPVAPPPTAEEQRDAIEIIDTVIKGSKCDYITADMITTAIGGEDIVIEKYIVAYRLAITNAVDLGLNNKYKIIDMVNKINIEQKIVDISKAPIGSDMTWITFNDLKAISEGFSWANVKEENMKYYWEALSKAGASDRRNAEWITNTVSGAGNAMERIMNVKSGDPKTLSWGGFSAARLYGINSDNNIDNAIYLTAQEGDTISQRLNRAKYLAERLENVFGNKKNIWTATKDDFAAILPAEVSKDIIKEEYIFNYQNHFSRGQGAYSRIDLKTTEAESYFNKLNLEIAKDNLKLDIENIVNRYYILYYTAGLDAERLAIKEENIRISDALKDASTYEEVIRLQREHDELKKRLRLPDVASKVNISNLDITTGNIKWDAFEGTNQYYVYVKCNGRAITSYHNSATSMTSILNNVRAKAFTKVGNTTGYGDVRANVEVEVVAYDKDKNEIARGNTTPTLYTITSDNVFKTIK